MSGDRLGETRQQADEVVGILRDNVEKILERDDKLTMLDERADALAENAQVFESNAKKAHTKFWLENLKVTIAIGTLTVLAIIALITIIALAATGKI